jgi:hypothetical protein
MFSKLKKRYITCLFTACAVSISCVPKILAEGRIIEVSTKDELINVLSQDESYKGDVVILKNDINLTEEDTGVLVLHKKEPSDEFKQRTLKSLPEGFPEELKERVLKGYIPIFSGTFDGQGHTIQCNVKFEGGRRGLFGILKYSAIIKNINIKGNFEGDGFGIIAKENHGRIENVFLDDVNCKFGHGKDCGYALPGGLCCENDGTVIECRSSGNFEAIDCGCSALVGHNFTGLIDKCTVSNAKINGCDGAGRGGDFGEVAAIISFNWGRCISCTVENCEINSRGRDDDDHYGVGAPLVSTNSGEVTCCNVKNTKIDANLAGGLVGANYGLVKSCSSIETTVLGRHAAAFAEKNQPGDLDMFGCSLNDKDKDWLINIYKNHNDGTIEKCIFTGSITGREAQSSDVVRNLCGIVEGEGEFDPQIKDCEVQIIS